MGEHASVWLPDGSSTIAAQVDPLFWFVFWTSTIIFALVMAAMVYFAVRYRRRKQTEVPEPAHEHRIMELSWIVIPTILVLTVFTWGVNVFIDQNNPPPDSYQVTVHAQQWAWVFDYPNGVQSPAELVVPVGRPVKLNMSSSDVIHSFYVPSFRIKMDVLPNRYTSVWFEATDVGEYQVFCTEYCGTQHSGMLAKVRVVSESEFQTWLQEQNQDLPPAELGQQTFVQCAICHSTDGSTIVGPPLNGLIGKERAFTDGTSLTADENYIRQSITDPASQVVEGFQPVMPAGFGASLSDRQIDGLIAYIKTLE